LALEPSESLGPLNYEGPFFPIDCLLSPSFTLQLPQFLLHTNCRSAVRKIPKVRRSDTPLRNQGYVL